MAWEPRMVIRTNELWWSGRDRAGDAVLRNDRTSPSAHLGSRPIHNQTNKREELTVSQSEASR